MGGLARLEDRWLGGFPRQFVWAKYIAITREGWAILIFPDEQSFIERKDPIRIWLSDGTTENVLSLIRLNEELEKELSKQP